MLVLILSAGLLFMLPLVPAIAELRLKRDAQPLDVIQQYGGDIRHFAHGFRRVAIALQTKLQECVASGTTATGRLPDGDEYVLLGGADEECPPIRAHRQRVAQGLCSGLTPGLQRNGERM